MTQWKAFVRDTLILTCLLMVVKIIISKELTIAIAFESLLTAVLSNALLFTFGRRVFGSLATKMKESLVKLNEGEIRLLDEAADHFKGIERVGGRLILTNMRLIFTSHKYNIQNHSWCTPVSDIIFVSRDDDSSGYQLNVTLTNLDVHRFRVISPGRWVETISKHVQFIRN